MKLLAIMAAWGLLLAASAHVPYQWTHALSGGCSWHTRPPVGLLGRGSPDTDAIRAQGLCWARRGAHDPDALPTLKVLLRRFPSEAELSAWNGETK